MCGHTVDDIKYIRHPRSSVCLKIITKCWDFIITTYLLIVRTSGRKLKDCHVRTRYIIIYKLLVSRSSESADDEINKYRKREYLFISLLFICCLTIIIKRLYNIYNSLLLA